MAGIVDDRLASVGIAEAEEEADGWTWEEAREAVEAAVVFKVLEGASKPSRSFRKMEPSLQSREYSSACFIQTTRKKVLLT
jgi:hypothetical protein